LAAARATLERKHSLENDSKDVKKVAARWPRLTIILVALALAIIVLFIQAPPTTVLGKADVIGYAICHRIPERSFIMGGRPLPLCARCTGTFLGAMLGLATIFLLRRQRAASLPPVPALILLAAFTASWGFDGLNSYLGFFPGAPQLYEPRNWLRLTTGLLNGLTLIFFAWPIFSFTLWRQPSRERVLHNIWELLALLPIVAGLVLVIQAEIDALLYPLAILSTLGVLVLLVIINTLVAAVLLRRDGYADTWRQALVPIIVGAALAILEITGMVLLRAYLTAALGLPF
jgi:uncharacterized membrane protein